MESEKIKEAVLDRIAEGINVIRCPKHKYKIGNNVIHVRYCTNPVGNTNVYGFNINPNTIASDYELWICGSEEKYYLIPISIIKKIYENPDSYVDYHHPEIRVANIDVVTHQCKYGRKCPSISLTNFFCSGL